MKAASAPASARLESNFKRFLHEEDGALALFMIVMFVLMLTFGGMAVDLMRFETRRVAVQQTMDRAALAAAGLTQKQTADTLVKDFFAKARITSGAMKPTDMVEIAVPTVVASAVTSTGANPKKTYSKVNVTSKIRSYNYFMDMFFMPTDFLESGMESQAEQGASKVEVMLVLDVSGSMNSNGKIASLRSAAKTFVTTVKGLDSLQQVSIGVVPYEAQVNLGKKLREQFTNVTKIPTADGTLKAGSENINCLEIPTSLYDSTALPTSTPLVLSAFADTWTGYSGIYVPEIPANPTAVPPVTLQPAYYLPIAAEADRFCPPFANNEVLMPTLNQTTAENHVAGLTAKGSTSIMVGMRWGAALLDPTANAIYKNIIADTNMHNRPAPVSEVTTRKIIVLMTDGEHQSTRTVADAYKTGPSPIYLVTPVNIVKTEKRTRRADKTWKPYVDQGTTVTSSGATFNVINFPDASKRPAESGANAFYAPALGLGSDPDAWLSLADGTPTQTVSTDGTTRTTTTTGFTEVQLDWSTVWQQWAVAKVANDFYGNSGVTGADRATMARELMDVFTSDPGVTSEPMYTNGQTATNYLPTYASFNTYKDTLLKQVCDKVKGDNIEVYGIALTAPELGQAAIKSCVSTTKIPDSHYFFIKPDQTDQQIKEQLETAFKTIASQITSLRLTQ
jgi:Flp pilus assembly protein TadG